MVTLRVFSGITLLVLLLPAAGCATQTVVSGLSGSTTFQDPYIGMHKDKILELWGKPTAMQEDGKGGSLLVYDRRKVLEWEELTAKNRAVDSAEPRPFFPPRGEKRATVLTEEGLKFWIDAQGFVVRTWYHPDLWKDGIPSPPPKPESKKPVS